MLGHACLFNSQGQVADQIDCEWLHLLEEEEVTLRQYLLFQQETDQILGITKLRMATL